MKTIQISAIPSQTFSSVLGGQNCQIKVYQKPTGVFIDVAMNSAPIVSGVLCRDRVKLIRQAYLGFSGDLFFCDMQGFSDPDYTGFGSRFRLVYMEPSDL